MLTGDSLMEYMIRNQEIKNIKKIKYLEGITWGEIMRELLKKEIRAEIKANRLWWIYLTPRQIDKSSR